MVPDSSRTNEATYIDLKPTLGSIKDDVINGLSLTQKELPAKLFYDARGSRLFDEICMLPEYYPTRTEISILANKAGPALHQRLKDNAQLVEFGAGNSIKIRVLLRGAGRFGHYVPIDISGEYLEQISHDLASDFPGLKVTAIGADYTQSFDLPDNKGAARVGFFPGSTIGNMTYNESIEFLKHIGGLLGKGSGLLIGADLKKDVDILSKAYNDELGVTAAFNLNVLRRLNREIGTDFDLTAFAHHAFYLEDQGRIEMHLISLKDQSVSLDDHKFTFAENETIHTENSHKFRIEEFQDLLRAAGYKPKDVWTDDQDLFSVHYATVAN